MEIKNIGHHKGKQSTEITVKMHINFETPEAITISSTKKTDSNEDLSFDMIEIPVESFPALMKLLHKVKFEMCILEEIKRTYPF